jgi:hypothetical protein
MIEGSLKSNFRKYEQMKRRAGKSQRREEKRKTQKKEDPGARTSWPDER